MFLPPDYYEQTETKWPLVTCRAESYNEGNKYQAWLLRACMSTTRHTSRERGRGSYQRQRLPLAHRSRIPMCKRSNKLLPFISYIFYVIPSLPTLPRALDGTHMGILVPNGIHVGMLARLHRLCSICPLPTANGLEGVMQN